MVGFFHVEFQRGVGRRWRQSRAGRRVAAGGRVVGRAAFAARRRAVCAPVDFDRVFRFVPFAAERRSTADERGVIGVHRAFDRVAGDEVDRRFFAVFICFRPFFVVFPAAFVGERFVFGFVQAGVFRFEVRVVHVLEEAADSERRDHRLFGAVRLAAFLARVSGRADPEGVGERAFGLDHRRVGRFGAAGGLTGGRHRFDRVVLAFGGGDFVFDAFAGLPVVRFALQQRLVLLDPGERCVVGLLLERRAMRACGRRRWRQ